MTQEAAAAAAGAGAGDGSAGVGAATGAFLTNGRWTTFIAASGLSATWYGDVALTRFRSDPVESRDGVHFYLRDVESGEMDSATFEPVRREAEREEFVVELRRAVIRRERGGLRSELAVEVDPAGPIERRLLTLTNSGRAARQLEIAVALEVVLLEAAADAAHPAFAKLFVQTEWVADREMLVARRRPRSATEQHPWLACSFVPEAGSGWGPVVEWETDRARFLGRGGSPARPDALVSGEPLSGTVGSVLDPVFCLRRRLVLEPGASATGVLVLAAGDTRERALEGLRGSEPPTGGAAAPRLPRDARAEWETSFPAPRVEPHAQTPQGRPHASPVRAHLTAAERAGANGGPTRPHEELQFWNGFGGFAADGKEYVIRLEPDTTGKLTRPPAPWTNVIANERIGFLVSETGAGCTWTGNSREHRLTPWSNDPVLDPHNEALYLRDEETGESWSPFAGPCPARAPYEVRHGFGRTVVRTSSHGLDQETTLFVARTDAIKFANLRITNRTDRARRVSAVAYQRLVLGVRAEDHAGAIVTEPGPRPGSLTATSARDLHYVDGIAFAAVLPPHGVEAAFATADRAAFLGRPGDVARPAALEQPESLAGRTGAGLDPCFATQTVFDVPPGRTVELAFVLGEAESKAGVAALLSRYAAAADRGRALEEVCAYYDDLLGRVHVNSRCPEIDLMVNGWTLYQALACRIVGRTAFYQSGGAFGFRDQLQDASAFLWVEPAILRRQLLIHAARQFPEGDVLHWWHEPGARGLRTRFADDLVWLPYLLAEYVQVTGDRAVLDEPLPFRRARLLEPGEDEAFLETEDAGESATLHEHAARALDRAMTRGPHGLPLFGTGDWNDGMNRVGREGRGESVWMAFFLAAAIDGFAPIAEARGETARAAKYRKYRADVLEAVEDTAWDGDWYLRGYYDDGTPLGSARGRECRIDALVQAWATLSGAAPPDRAARALDAAEEHLVDEDAGLIRLLSPPFDFALDPHDPGYIKGYVPGVRENGGQYTHAALWVVAALAKAGRRERAARLLAMLSPVAHTRGPADVARYKVEPYVLAADVYGAEPLTGRGGWTWYTGSSGWYFRVAVEAVLGAGDVRVRTA